MRDLSGVYLILIVAMSNGTFTGLSLLRPGTGRPQEGRYNREDYIENHNHLPIHLGSILAPKAHRIDRKKVPIG